MTQFFQDLGVLPTSNPFGIQLSEWVNGLLQTPGSSGVPDLLTEPAAAATYLDGVRETVIASSTLKPLIRIADSNLEDMWELDGELSVDAEEHLDDTGKAVVRVAYQHWMQDLLINRTKLVEDIHLLIDWDPVNPNWKRRWGGKVTEIHVQKDEKGVHTIELVALHHREHTRRLLVAANPVFPPEVQLPRMWVLPGPCRTICALTAFINLGRLFMPGWSGITNAFNPAAWLNPLNPDAALNLLPTEWPIQVAFVDPALDHSRWTSIGGQWTTWHDTFKDVLSDAGCMMRAYTYLTTDEDSPNTELASLLEFVPEVISAFTGVNLSSLDSALASAAAPQRNCVVISFEQIDGVTGPAGTIADGLLEAVAVTLDDLITPFVVDINTGNTYDPGRVLNGEPVQDAAGVGRTYLLEKLASVAPSPPQVIWWDGTYNGMISTDTTYHKGAVKTIMTGSKSPALINQALTFGIRYALAQLGQAIDKTVGFGVSQTVGVGAGIENLYQGQLDNCCGPATLVQGPDGDERIDVLAARGGPFRVWSITPEGCRTPATAAFAFKKGTAELFEYTLDDGRSIETTGEHRFLTDRGFQRAADVKIGTLLATVDHHELPKHSLELPIRAVTDESYRNVPATDAVKFRAVVSTRSIGVEDFYDMHVPGWENYSANGIWNHNTLFAWQRFTDPIRALYGGDHSWQEHFERGTGTAYTLSSIITLRSGDWKTRAFAAFQAETINGHPWIADYDYQLGDRVGYEQDGVIYVDNVFGVRRVYDWQQPLLVKTKVGEDKLRGDPFAAGFKTLGNLYSLVGMALGESTLFE